MSPFSRVSLTKKKKKRKRKRERIYKVRSIYKDEDFLTFESNDKNELGEIVAKQFLVEDLVTSLGVWLNG